SSNTETDTELSMDGQPMEGRGNMGGPSERSFSCSYTDTVLTSDAGAPLRVRRSFDEIEGRSMVERRGEPVESEQDSAFEGLTLVLEEVDGEVQITVEDGDEPEPERLDGFGLTLMLDALLPEDDVEVGGTWEVEASAFETALAAGMAGRIMDRPAPPEGGEGRRGRGRRRGGEQGRGGDALARLFSGDFEWTVEATLTDRTEEFGGVECVVITLEAEMQGNVPERERTGGRRGGGGDAVRAPSTPAAGTVSVELEGELLWNTKQDFPARLTVTGTVESEERRSRETERGYFEMNRSSTTEVETTIEIAVPTGDDDESDD
ncbi:MAG: hypothetical protein AAFZ87_08890, partial [Planctomycetota bacterium]